MSDAIQIRTEAGQNLFVFLDTELKVTSQFNVTTLTGSELLQAVEMFNKQRSLNLDGENER